MFVTNTPFTLVLPQQFLRSLEGCSVTHHQSAQHRHACRDSHQEVDQQAAQGVREERRLLIGQTAAHRQKGAQPRERGGNPGEGEGVDDAADVEKVVHAAT